MPLGTFLGDGHFGRLGVNARFKTVSQEDLRCGLKNRLRICENSEWYLNRKSLHWN